MDRPSSRYTTNEDSCTCRFSRCMLLPCCHILAATRDNGHDMYFPDGVADRWTREYNKPDNVRPLTPQCPKQQNELKKWWKVLDALLIRIKRFLYDLSMINSLLWYRRECSQLTAFRRQVPRQIFAFMLAETQPQCLQKILSAPQNDSTVAVSEWVNMRFLLQCRM